MKILKHRGFYLEHKAKLNKNISIFLFIICFGGLIYSFLFLKFNILHLFIIILISSIGSYFFKNYTNYKKGIEGENLVIKYLRHLSDDYYLINDIKLKGSLDIY